MKSFYSNKKSNSIFGQVPPIKYLTFLSFSNYLYVAVLSLMVVVGINFFDNHTKTSEPKAQEDPSESRQPTFKVNSLNVKADAMMDATCSCVEYVYLNDEGPIDASGNPLAGNDGFVHKFLVNADGTLTEVDGDPITPGIQPWVPVGGGLENPHGLAQDPLTGNVFIGRFTGGPIAKLDCDGNIINNNFIPTGGYNFRSVNGIIYVPLRNSLRIQAYSTCDGTSLGYIDLGGVPPANTFITDWGFYIDPSGVFYATLGFQNYQIRSIYRFTPTTADFNSHTVFPPLLTQDPSLVLTGSFPELQYPFPHTGNSPLGISKVSNQIYGITADASGNFYIVIQDESGPGTSPRTYETWVLKYNSAGMRIDSFVQVASTIGGIVGARGIVYDPDNDVLYLGGGPVGDCVAILSSDLDVITTGVPNVPGQLPKGISLAKECCPTAGVSINDTALCNIRNGKVIFLQNLLISCGGPACGSTWTPSNVAGILFQPCDNSITILDSSIACGSFTVTGGGGTSQCGAFSITFNLSSVLNHVVVEGDTIICLNTSPGTLQSSITTNADMTTYQWQSSMNCDDAFTDIPLANNSTFTPLPLSQTTYYRLITESSRDCAKAFCTDTSECIKVTVVECNVYSLGNTVWADANNNGIIDAGEAGIPNVKVILHYYNPMTMMTEALDSVLTDANGGYLFAMLTAGTYFIEIPQSNFAPGGPLEGFASSSGTNGSSVGPYEDGLIMNDVDTLDSDDNGTALSIGGVWSDSIVLNGNEPVTDTAGLDDNSGSMNSNSNLTIDFGFYPLHSIGNLVWIDANNNGKLNAGEKGIDSVKVILHYFNGTTCVAIDSQYTDANGGYLFDSLVAGKYLVEIAAINFTTGKRLNKYASSSGSGAVDPNTGPYEKAPDPDGNIDNDDNGTMNGNLMFPGAVFSDTLDLNGNEPVSPNDTTGKKDLSGAADIMSNLTVDFGFFPLHSLGNQLFVDANNDGKMQPTESPLPGVKMILHYVDTTGGGSVCVTIDSILTDVNGKYVFDSLIAGKYIVEVAKSNFAPGGVLAAYASSTGGGSNTKTGPYEVPGMPIDGDTPADSTDHGVAGTGTFLGSVIGDTVDIGSNEPKGEPNDTTAIDSLSNLTMDFGFFPLHSLGNYVWADANNNGVVDPGETAIPNVKVILHYVQANGTCISLDSVLTDASGGYIFDTLIAGTYLIEIAPSNFAPGGPLAGYVSSTGVNGSPTGPYEMGPQTADVDANNNDDNGTALAIGGVWSDSIKLAGNEPISPIDSAGKKDLSGARDSMSNLTIDFGFYPLHSIGNQVWFDTNADGKDSAEAGIANVLVILHYYNGSTCIIVDSQYTNASGGYLFDSLIAGKYLIEIAASNFNPGNPLENYLSTTGAGIASYTGPNEPAPDPDDPMGNGMGIDNDDNGTMNGNPMFPGSVFSDTLDLNGNEPISPNDTAGLDDNSGAADIHSNLTVDFGFVPRVVDLALTKKVSVTTPGPYSYGNTIKFDLIVSNQGNVFMDSIQVYDTIPVGFSFNALLNPDWSYSNSTATTLIKTRLNPGTSNTVCIYLTVIPVVNPSQLQTAWINNSEISAAFDTTGKEVSAEDIDGKLDNNPMNNPGGMAGSPADNYVKGDGTGTVGNGVDSTDLDSQDPALVSIVDLALKKVLDPSIHPPYNLGDTVKFQIQVFNQGNVPVDSINIIDSIPSGYTYDASLNPGWTGSGPVVTYEWGFGDTLGVGESDTICIYMTIFKSPGIEGPASFINRSEISYLRDTADIGTDADSPMDGIVSNDGGGSIGTPSDDEINGDGSGAPGDKVDSTDEDNEDPASLEILDVGLYKQIDSTVLPSAYHYGDLIKFKMVVGNQGNILLKNIKVTDYIPAGFEYVNVAGNAGWISLNDSTAERTITGNLLPWDDTTICIYLKLKQVIPYVVGAWTNRSEVSSVQDKTGTTHTDDIDSPLDNNRNNNPGGAPNSMADDVTTGDGKGTIGDGVAGTDQDNADPARIRIFDLALKKTTTKVVVGDGESVPFSITVYNQGNEPMKNIKITDYIPSDFTFQASTGWSPVGIDKACYTIPGPLNAGDSITLPILNLQVGNPTLNLPSGLYNYAEVTTAEDTTGATPVDIDSNWDGNNTNDSGGDLFNSDDNNITGDSFKGEDEDDHDGAYVIVCKGYVCQAKVNISLGENCEVTVTGYDVLTHPLLPSIYYRVTLKDQAGNVVPNATFTRANLGYCYTYSVDAPICPSNGCWGTICVEDKFPPAIDCTPDTILCFELNQIPAELVVNDNCAGPVKVSIKEEVYVDYGCDSALFQGVVKRKLIASDPWGNVRQCDKWYYIRKIQLSEVICPRDTTVDCSLATVGGVRFGSPTRSGAPRIGSTSLWPNNASCKLTISYKDDSLVICGGGYKILRSWTISDWCTQKDTICKQVIKVEDKTAPTASSIVLPTRASDPHDCNTNIYLDTLAYSDCNNVIQTYQYNYLDEATGVIKIASGTLPASVWIGSGTTVITVKLTDQCFNMSSKTITVTVEDRTPPNPVCHQFVQVTLDPNTCWAQVKAKDLDNGSKDNCVSQLHYAAALMTDIENARNKYADSIIAQCGKTAYWADKAWHDAYIDEWINCYVFKDLVELTDCGTNQVVMRVYENDSMPRYDSHVFGCSEHAWYCYNTYQSYRTIHNYNFFSSGIALTKNCKATGPWLCKTASNNWYSNYTQYRGSFYSGANKAPANFPQTHLYNDCMVNVLVDDKQPPLVEHLQDITIFCDGAPYGSGKAEYYCQNTHVLSPWPGTISIGGTIHGYYGGSSYVTGHTAADEHGAPVIGCPNGEDWAPIYCRDWLVLDSLDQAGKANPSDYFDKLVLFDKNRPVRTLTSGEFSITDNCKLDDGSLVITNAGTINGCGEGWLSRTWTIKDKCGNPVTATQKVYVKHRSDFEVIFPADKIVTCDPESGVNKTDTSVNGAGKPIFSDDECEQLGLNYSDEIFKIVDSACYKIVRTWTVIDWCIYDPNAHYRNADVIVDDTYRANTTDRVCTFRNLKDDGDGYLRYIQVIKVIDRESPVVTCADQTIQITKDCSAAVNIPLKGTDNCSEEIYFRADITRPDGSHDRRQDIKAITGTFYSGIYNIQIIGRDKCGNEDTCSMNLTVTDGKKPTPYCIDGIATVVMPSSGTVEVWAKDLDRASEDNCTSKDKLKFSFSKNTSTASRIMTCKDIPNGKEQSILVEIWVTDEAGNADFCRTHILLQDNGSSTGNGACKDTTLGVASITGRLFTENKEGVEYANVQVNGTGVPSYKTAIDGSYTFSSIPMNGGASIKALRDDNPMNGVSTLDLVLIQKHILGTEKLNSPYKMIAADINNSNDITAIDLIELRKLILGIYDKLPTNTSWKFVPKSYAFPDLQTPWGYPTEDVLHEMSENMVRDFVGVKIGDVNSSAIPHSLMGTEIRGNETGLILEVKDQVFRAGEKVEVTFRSPNFKGITGMQGTMKIEDRSLKLEGIEQSGILKVGEQNFGRRWENEGLITMSWNTSTSMDVKDDAVLFTMNFIAQTAGRLSEVLRIGSQHTLAESYEGKGELGNLSIRFINAEGHEVTGKSELYQNYPNPFDHRTVIGVNLSDTGRGTLKITDVTGRTIKVIEQDWTKGYHEVWLDRRDIQASGVLYYSFESKTFRAVKKMVIIE